MRSTAAVPEFALQDGSRGENHLPGHSPTLSHGEGSQAAECSATCAAKDHSIVRYRFVGGSYIMKSAGIDNCSLPCGRRAGFRRCLVTRTVVNVATCLLLPVVAVWSCGVAACRRLPSTSTAKFAAAVRGLHPLSWSDEAERKADLRLDVKDGASPIWVGMRRSFPKPDESELSSGSPHRSE